MKKTIYIIVACLLGLSLVSCQQKEEPFEPGPQPEGSQYYFSNEAVTSFTLNSSMTEVDVKVYRIVKDAAASLTVSVSDASGVATSASSLTMSFAAGSNEATAKLPINLDDLEYGKAYPIVLTINDNTTPYGIASQTVTVTYPIPLTSLGRGKFTDDYYFGDTTSPEILQSDIDPKEFHVKTPYAGITGGGSDLVFYVTEAGKTYGGITISQDGLIYFKDTFTGYNHPSYSDDLYLVHPSRFTSLSAEENWAHNRVLSWQDNGLPAIVQLAPYYYMFNTGGWKAIEEDEAVLIVFPGVVIKDYSVSASYTGYFTSSEGEVNAVANASFGKDVQSGRAVLVAGEDPKVGLALIEAGDESVVSFTGSEVSLPFPEGAGTGHYTIVIASYADGAIQESASATFFYQVGDVTLDWAWLEGNWKGIDYSYAEDALEGDAYPMTIEKIDETHCKIYNIWASEGEVEGIVDFENLTLTIPGYQNVFANPQYSCDMYFVAVDPENEFEPFEDLKTAVVAKLSPSGIVIDNYDFLMVGGKYDGYVYDGGIKTTMTK